MRRLLLFSCVWVASCQIGSQATSRQYACDTSDDCAAGNLCVANVCITRDEFFAMTGDAGRDAGPGGGSGGGLVETGGGSGGGDVDAGPDAGAADGGAPDAGAPDAGTTDAGAPDGGCDAGTGLELCSDGVDNNCNGLVDCGEPSCATMGCGLNGRVCTGLTCVCGGGEASELTCNDTRDNDCDGLIDCADMTCSGRACGANGRTCSGTSCTCSGNGGTAQASESTCNDTRDNDCDGLVDCADPTCSGQACGANGRTCAGTSCTCSGNGGAAQASESTCNDTRDNDCDGLVDCADSTCSGQACGANGRTCSGTSCTCSGNGGTAQTNETTCGDTRDNDCDGLVDCADSQCAGMTCGANGRTCAGTSCTCSGNGGSAQATETSCTDGFDNDCDGLVDAADPSCPAADAGSGDGGVTYVVSSSTQPFVDACSLGGSTRYMFADPDDDSTPVLTMPFAFSFYGAPVSQYWVGTNGNIVFNTSRTGTNNTSCMPSTAMPHPAVYVAFNDIITTNGLCVGTMGTAPNRKLVVTWPNMDHFDFPGANMTFAAVLSETTNTIDLTFATMTGDAGSLGADAITAVQNTAGDRYTQYRCHMPAYLTSGLAIRFTPQ